MKRASVFGIHVQYDNTLVGYIPFIQNLWNKDITCAYAYKGYNLIS